MKTEHEFELGDIAKDTITGFRGVVYGITTWLNGCVRISIQPKGLKDGKPVDAITFDVEQLKLVKKAVHKQATRSGGPCKDPVR